MSQSLLIRLRSQKGNSSSTLPGMSYGERALFTVKFIPVGRQCITNNGFVTGAKLQLLLDEYAPSNISMLLLLP